MNVICDIVWTARAEKDLNNIFDYLESNWTQREIDNFAGLLENNIELIAKCPNLFQFYDMSRNIHKCVISSQISVFYAVDFNKNTIAVLALFDNRRNPKSLNI
ncbi:MAG: type II toxin-antitoxin system RelE/ParE family toxin [Candidatus Azobacteroides sp.]|nr:type II toxin-antitoxin system RelE/ParE family toxin [Candidatus Azobacteroides sp.]